MNSLYLVSIAAGLSLGSVARAERPAFDVPQKYICKGVNHSGQPVATSVALSGDATSTSFTIEPLSGSVWPRRPIELSGLRASYFEDENSRLWYWVKTDLLLEGEPSGFGFDVKVNPGQSSGAIRFSRTKYSRWNGSGDVQSDPKGAYLDDVPCIPANGMN